jgi:sugar phosphate isomerase/epimerase
MLVAMPLYVATACVAAATTADALATLEAWETERACASPGRPPGVGWHRAADRFGERLHLHHACLEAPGQPRWNLAARDEGWRRRAVEGAIALMREAADRGAPAVSLHAGQALELGLGPDGLPVGPGQARAKALEWLAVSLDRLASTADDLGLALWLENPAGRRERTGRAAREVDPFAAPLLQEPDEIARTFERVAAPMLGLLLDTAHLLLSCQARRWEPEPVLAELQPWVRAIALSGTDGRQDLHRLPRQDAIEVQLARQAGGLALPVILEARAVSQADLQAALPDLAAALAP